MLLYFRDHTISTNRVAPKMSKKLKNLNKKDIFSVWKGPKVILLEFLSCLYSKNDLIKLNTYYVIVESSSSFLSLFLYKDAYFSTLYFSTYRKPLNKYLCTIPLSCFILRVTRGPILESSLCAIPEIAPRLKPFWKCLWLRGCPVGFLLPLFREFKYSNRTK